MWCDVTSAYTYQRYVHVCMVHLHRWTFTCSSRRGSRRCRRGRSTSAVSRAGDDSVGRSDSRRATRPRVPPGSSGRRPPADRTRRPARACPPPLRRRRPRSSRCHRGPPRRLRRATDDVPRRPSWSSWSLLPLLSRPATANKPRRCRLPRRSRDTAGSPLHRRLITPASATSLSSLFAVYQLRIDYMIWTLRRVVE